MSKVYVVGRYNTDHILTVTSSVKKALEMCASNLDCSVDNLIDYGLSTGNEEGDWVRASEGSLKSYFRGYIRRSKSVTSEGFMREEASYYDANCFSPEPDAKYGVIEVTMCAMNLSCL
jgi:hypothetical protein